MKRVIWLVVFALVVGFSGGAFAGDPASIYAAKCAMCHGKGGEGSTMAPALKGTDFIKGDAEAIKDVITNGRSGSAKKYPKFPIAMPKFKFSDAELDALVKYLKSL